MSVQTPQPATAEAIRAMLGPEGWRAPDDAAAYFEDPRGRFTGRGLLIAMPDDTQGIAELLRYCNDTGTPVIPYGGGTGVVAGQLSIDSDAVVILSLERMDRMRDLSLEDGAITVEAGAILEQVHEMAAAHGMTFPLSMGSKGSCTIGGNLATNAGGIQVLRDGNARDLCLGIEAVFADGSVLSELTPLRKNNIGYDLRHLLIGSEGTLGVITAATLAVRPMDAETVTAFCGLDSPRKAVALLGALRADFGASISALELMSDFGVELATRTIDTLRSPLADQYPWYLLVEVGGAEGLRARFETSLEQHFERGLLADATIADTIAQCRGIWALRELTPEVNRRNGAICSSDTSVPISRIDDFIARTHDAMKAIHPGLRVNSYGHIGDGNIHHNVFPPTGADKQDFLSAHQGINDAVRIAITRISHELGGSISAEHGIGRLKTEDLGQFASDTRLEMMRRVKAALDPKGIMNPGALLPATAQEVSPDSDTAESEL